MVQMKFTKETLGEKLADRVAGTLGSWKFIIIQLIIIVLWATINTTHKNKVDPYPYSFLNLILGIQSALTGPILLIAGNRKEEMDRNRAIENLEIDKISHDDLKRISKRIEDQFHHLDNDLGEIIEDLEKS